MKYVVLIGVLFLGHGVSLLRAGSVITLADSPEVTGTLTLTPGTIHVENSLSPADINLADVLEADFGETPFHLDYYVSSGDAGNQLPANWKEQDLGTVNSPGSAVVAAGTFTLNGNGASSKPAASDKSAGTPKPVHGVSDTLFFAGQPWTGGGEWTARVKEIDAKTPETAAGLMLRGTLDADSEMFSLEATAQGVDGYAIRAETGKSLERTPVPMDLPIWLRLTRYGDAVFASISSDGNEWDTVGLHNFKTMASPWIGLFADSHKDRGLGTAVIDQVSFTPAPSSAQVLPCGVLLQSGSFLAGTFEHLGFDPADPDAPGTFHRNENKIEIPPSKIAAVTLLPTERSEIAKMGSHVGLLMKNGDVMDGDFDSIHGTAVVVNSVLLGLTTYNRHEVSACFLHPLQAQPASYEIRLRDGSIIHASSLDAGKGEVVIEEVSGVKVDVTLNEIAQLRAGPALVQSLAELNWKATPPATPPSPATPATNAAPAVPDQPPPAAPIVNTAPTVQSWEGPNQEQIIEAPVGTTVDFPLAGKFRAVGMRIALSPDSPPNSQLIVRLLADGREIGRTPPFKAGDQPRFMEIPIQNPRTLSLEAESAFAGSKVLFIDPVAIRNN